MIIPATRYKDCEAALGFLKEAFGLHEHAIHRDEAGNIVHAQLMHAGGMVMFGPARDGEFDKLMTDPAETGGRETTTIYVVVRDVPGLYEQAKERGAKILLPLRHEDYGGQSFTAADPEGHIWSFGSYDPLAPHPA
ncbi:hypothetical protein DEA8626_01582 [Defluviimonas aquaemixtae]|uniref:VOC domain-containing protein n=1 Tax=Albidovulum aquaemixtae TaxID=1542388 RepID=A0A2R8B647_9RHOB|nr:VOC family protein [Defluviimonas aquaemixtae]SPH18052.1 hypothetical protein DEA8626_01582 [Defluviimonas aquaemixtae]